MAQNCFAPVRVRMAAEASLLMQFDHAYVAFGSVVVGRDSPVGGEAEVVVLPVTQPPLWQGQLRQQSSRTSDQVLRASKDCNDCDCDFG